MNKSTSIYLLLGSFLMVVTMVLHPTGGNFIRLIQNSSIAIISHAIAIFSVPFSALGFLGLTKYLEKAPFLSCLALSMMLTGLIAAMLAAAVNGLTLPLFALQYQDASPEVIEAIRPIFRYNMALNHAFDYILIGGMFISVLLWSGAIIQTKALPIWLGYLGVLLVVTATLAIVLGFYFLDLHGFRVFILGWVLWITLVAIFIYQKKNKPILA